LHKGRGGERGRELVGDGNGVVVGVVRPLFSGLFFEGVFFLPDLLFFGGKGPTGPPSCVAFLGECSLELGNEAYLR
jgi:hypothetical protein